MFSIYFTFLQFTLLASIYNLLLFSPSSSSPSHHHHHITNTCIITPSIFRIHHHHLHHITTCIFISLSCIFRNSIDLTFLLHLFYFLSLDLITINTKTQKYIYLLCLHLDLILHTLFSVIDNYQVRLRTQSKLTYLLEHRDSKGVNFWNTGSPRVRYKPSSHPCGEEVLY